MKVEPRPTEVLNTETTARITDRIDTTRSRAVTPGAISDQVAISPDVQLANEAMRAANNASDVRPDEVARAREALNRGEIGANLDSLASKIIDSLINKP